MTKKKVLLDILKYVIFFGIGMLLFFWVYKGQNVKQIWGRLSEFDYTWIGFSFIAFLGSILFRALRWNMLIGSIGYKPRIINTFLSVLVMYLANTAVTRMGEVARCGILKKYEKVPFTAQLGTVMIERVVDVLFLAVLLALVFFFNWDILSTLLIPDPNAAPGKFAILQSPLFWILIGLMVVAALSVFLLRKKLMRIPIVIKLLSYVEKFVDGLKSVLKLRQPVLFIIYTVALYGCYFLNTLFILKAFGPTAALSPMVSVSVLAMGSVGMVVPVPSGFGPYDWFALHTLMLYGVMQPEGQLVTLVLHLSTILFIIVCGAIALGLLPVINKKRDLN